MAELSIVGFVVGSLSFIVAVRNAIERLLHDADTFKIHTEILVPLSGRLDLLSIHLKIWQTFWHIHDGTPSDLFSSYWGECGSGEIRKLLSHVYSQFEKVEAEFGSKYGHVLHDLIRRETHLYRDQGKLKDAEKMFQRAVLGRRKVLGLDHPHTLEMVNDLKELAALMKVKQNESSSNVTNIDHNPSRKRDRWKNMLRLKSSKAGQT